MMASSTPAVGSLALWVALVALGLLLPQTEGEPHHSLCLNSIPFEVEFDDEQS